jgi:hypothetical protein
MRSYFAPEQFLQSKTQSTGSVSSAIPLTYCEKGEVYEKTQSDFADLREPREDERSRRERCTVQCKQSDADARLPLRPLGTPVQPSSRAPAHAASAKLLGSPGQIKNNKDRLAQSGTPPGLGYANAEKVGPVMEPPLA